MDGDIEVRKVSDNKYVINIPGEDHTLGSLLQEYLSKDERVELAYYNAPHPLENRIEIFMSLKSGEDPLRVLVDALDKIIEKTREAEERLLEAYKEAGIELE